MSKIVVFPSLMLRRLGRDLCLERQMLLAGGFKARDVVACPTMENFLVDHKIAPEQIAVFVVNVVGQRSRDYLRFLSGATPAGALYETVPCIATHYGMEAEPSDLRDFTRLGAEAFVPLGLSSVREAELREGTIYDRDRVKPLVDAVRPYVEGCAVRSSDCLLGSSPR